MQVHITGGYFISDSIAILSFGSDYVFAIDDKRKDPPKDRLCQLLSHHVICLVAFVFALKDQVCLWFINLRFLTEVPNIFINITMLLTPFFVRLPRVKNLGKNSKQFR